MDRSEAVPEEPANIPTAHVNPSAVNGENTTLKQVAELVKKMGQLKATPILGVDFTQMGKRPRRASTHLVSINRTKVIDDDSSATNMVATECCGGGCCALGSDSGASTPGSDTPLSISVPQNAAFRSLRLKLTPLKSKSKLSGVTELPAQDRFIQCLPPSVSYASTVEVHPPGFVKPHPPYNVYSAKLHSARQLTRNGAEKPTYHFELDVTDYPDEIQGVDFRVGGAIGVMAPNFDQSVNEVFDRLEISEENRDAPILIKTTGGRWPTMWGEEAARVLVSTRRELLTWTVDIQSYAPKKQLLRVLAEYAADESEKTILLYLCSKQGQAAFCE